MSTIIYIYDINYLQCSASEPRKVHQPAGTVSNDPNPEQKRPVECFPFNLLVPATSTVHRRQYTGNSGPLFMDEISAKKLCDVALLRFAKNL